MADSDENKSKEPTEEKNENKPVENKSENREEKTSEEHKRKPIFTKKRAYSFMRKNWPAIAVLLIIILSMHVRLLDYRWPYLRNIDSYMFYRQMDYIVQNGGVMPLHDSLILAPGGSDIRPELYPYQYLGAYSYMFVHIFAQSMELWEYLIYFPVILASLMAIPMYYIGKILYDKRAGVLAAFFIVFNFINVPRSLGGDPDSDAIVMLMPLIVMAIFLLTYKYIAKEKVFNKRAILYSVLTGATLGIWSHTWIGYWYTFWLIMGFVFLKIIIDYLMIRNVKQVWSDSRHLVYSFIIIFLMFSAVVIPFYGIDRVTTTFTAPFGFEAIKSEEGIQFPNVYVSVQELVSGGDLGDVVQKTSPINFGQNPISIFVSPFFLMLYAFIYMLYSFYKKGQHLDTFILLFIWFIGPFIATMTAVRFTILFAAPMSIGSAIIIAKLFRMTTGEDKKLED